MAVNPLTPGVYIDEVSVFPPSVAPVATAVPAFIGYTASGPALTPTRITSMLEYEQIFGKAFAEQFTITLTGSSFSSADTSIAVGGTLKEFTMHYNLRMYFANGGGPCYIISVGGYGGTISHTALIDGVNISEKADEVTLLVVPEAVASTINSSQRALIHSTQLDLCNKMKDRFSLMDVVTTFPAVVGSINSDATAFRNNETGLNNLKYGASYYPSLDTILTRYYLDSDIIIDDDRTGNDLGPFDTKTLADVASATSTYASGIITIGTSLVGPDLTDGETFTINGIDFVAKNVPFTNANNSVNPFKFDIGASNVASAANLIIAINTQTIASAAVTASVGSPANKVIVTADVLGASGNLISFIDLGANFTAVPTTGKLGGGINTDITLYNSITAALQAKTMRLYPSSTMAGIYATVDRDRGVWKAPANVSLTGVIAPSVNISAAEQENLNVDAGSGKSINAIRAFAGKGILVWGGRTLAGNDNEWRYINVRRLFIFAEESIMKASEFVVFEPNDANTWSRVRSLISSFLTNLWRDGALAGATPAQAFFVRVGLGETMTAQDILEGKMIIEVGLAAVRPAEFIVLKFSHKLQEA